MHIGFICLALSSVLLSALSQIALKAGMTSTSVQSAIGTSDPVKIAVAVTHSWLVLGGLLSFGASAVIWLAVLSRIPLSSAYPVVALGIVITTVAGISLFNEPFPPIKALGLLFIVGGVMVVAFSR